METKHAIIRATTGDTVTFSVTVTNIATLPITYSWRKGFAEVARQPVMNQYTSTFSITSVQPANAGNYRVFVTNPATTSPGVISDQATLTVE